MSHHHRPDPGPEGAERFLRERYATGPQAHTHVSPRRSCIGCGGSGMGAGLWMCTGSGAILEEYCIACREETGNGIVWRHIVRWSVLARPVEQQGLGL